MLPIELFDYDLPKELIAQEPLKERDRARLMVLNLRDDRIIHSYFYNLHQFLRPGDLIVINKTKVIKARLLTRAEDTGGKLEIFFVEYVDEKRFKALVSPRRKAKVGRVFKVENERLEIEGFEGDKALVRILTEVKVTELLDKYGLIPLPHYIKRMPKREDEIFYQTVYAEKGFSVAAPTAGLHFTPRVFEELDKKGVKVANLYLHVGTGTFKPIKVEDVTQHRMDAEYYEIPEETAKMIEEVKSRGGRVIACGTTSVRALESWKFDSSRQAGATDLFIYPGFQFSVIDGMITNFHLPKSTPLILVSALVGRDKILRAYEEAIKERYRFLSYGDAILILPEID